MDKDLKQIKPMLCPVCGRFYFSELLDVAIEQLSVLITKGLSQKDRLVMLNNEANRQKELFDKNNVKPISRIEKK